MKKKDINQLELDLSEATQRVETLTETLTQTKLDLREAKQQRKSLKKQIVLARSEATKKQHADDALRSRIRRNVVSYCLSEGINLSDAWTHLYERLKTTTGVNPFQLGLGSRASRLEHVQEAGLLPPLFKLLPTLESLKPCEQ